MSDLPVANDDHPDITNVPSTSSNAEASGSDLSRKRTLSTSQDDEGEHKRPRLSPSLTIDIQAIFSSGVPIPPPRSLRPRPPQSLGSDSAAPLTRHRSRTTLSRASSSASLLLSRAATPVGSFTPFTPASPASSFTALFPPPSPARSFSQFPLPSPSIRSNSPAVVPYPETSAKFHLRNGKLAIDFQGAADETLGTTWPVSWSLKNTLVFGRGNRVHLKNLSTTEDVAALVKLKESHGTLRLLECAGEDAPHTVALATSTGLIQIWDVAAKKMTSSWTTKPVTAMKWAGPVLSVGGEKGAIRHFDTRVKDTGRMKDQTKKVLRHQARIGVLAWNHAGRVLASGDDSGVIYCWDARQNAPLDVGELVQRRRKMQHVGAVKALAWCPWSLKVLASGDAAVDGTGTVRLWSVNEATPKPPIPDSLALDAQITSLQWSTQCKELLSTHGMARITEDGIPSSSSAPSSGMGNAVAVHSFPNLTHVTTLYPATSAISGSILSPNGQRIVFAVPDEKQLKIWDVWGKRKELKRQRSLIEGPCGIR
ncbi:WD40 repeat-like protein [Artomyces pyxidatus]|uniref:WD40 repeat-like protein n=1 Tax=Artomyces pyxidatus TaxID=48021 RepID=A0ACB8SLT3_9AGAM|nr:WD40 repeat-like protein [Artomyces pyxidatus]